MIAIIDYGVGNLFSLRSSFAMIGEQAVFGRRTGWSCPESALLPTRPAGFGRPAWTRP